MGFAFYPNGTNQDTAGPIKEVVKPNPVEEGEVPSKMPEDEKVLEPSFDQNLSHKDYIDDVVHNVTAVNSGRRADIIKDMLGYAEGSPVIVTYYAKTDPESDVKGTHNNIDLKKHDVHKNRLKIHQFEMRLLSSLQYEHDAENNVNAVSGEAVVYPGFNPNKGDQFVMEIARGKWAMMGVDQIPQRTSIKSGTCYKIHFSANRWMNAEIDEELESHVITEAWFDKQRYLNEPGALLYHNEFVAMKFLDLHSAKLLQYYNNKFIERKIMHTYIRPSDGVYDPYVTDFMFQITDYNETGIVVDQLIREAPCLEVSFWRALLNQTIPLEVVPTSSVIVKRRLGSKTVVANALINKMYLAWEEGSKSLAEFFEEEDSTADGDETAGDVTVDDFADPDKDRIIGDLLLHIHPHYRECILTCCGNCTACGDQTCDDTNTALAYLLDGSDDYKKLIRDFLKHRKVNLEALMACIKNVYKLPVLQQFYKMPVLIFLARTAIRYIHNNAGIYE